MSAQKQLKETSPTAALDRVSRPDGGPALGERNEIKIGKTVVPRPAEGEGVVAEVFTMTLGSETIPLLPLKTWAQLDAFKWRSRGLLPRAPMGLEITFDHVKVTSETVSPWDPEACAKLEKAFNDWLAVEIKTLELAMEKIQTPRPATPAVPGEAEAVHFRLETDRAGHPRLKCIEGAETVKIVALNPQGFNALIEEGLMRKPGALKVGAMHDWVELDGELFRFSQNGTNAAAEFEKALNERYAPAPEPGGPPDIQAFANPASPTGFDVQFSATANGLAENRRRHLNEETVELLQDAQRCRVLRKGMIAKLTSPNLIFKLKTLDGGEHFLDPSPETTVSAVNETGQTKIIDLSQPVSLLDLSPSELTAVLNHPAINRRAQLAESASSRAA